MLDSRRRLVPHAISLIAVGMESDPQNPRYLITEPGVGYRLLGEDR